MGHSYACLVTRYIQCPSTCTPPPLSKHAKSQKNDGQTGSCA